MILVMTYVPDFTVSVTDDSRYDVCAGLYCLRHINYDLVVTCEPDFTVSVTDDSRYDVCAGLYCLCHR